MVAENWELSVKVKSILTWAQYFVRNALTPTIPENPENLYRVNETFNAKISHWQGDITALEVDAIVNAGNPQLQAGGGVGGAIHARAGEDLQIALNAFNGCEVGETVITPGFGLPAKYVIISVGPIEVDGQKLSMCYQNSFKKLLEAGLRTIVRTAQVQVPAFPCISTGIYGFPKEAAAHTALKETRDFLTDHSDEVDRIIFCTFTEEDKQVYMMNYSHAIFQYPDNLHTMADFNSKFSQLPEETHKPFEKYLQPANVVVNTCDGHPTRSSCSK